MRYLALCTDYDGTLAHHGKVDAPTIAALEKFRASGRKLVLVTGRAVLGALRRAARKAAFEEPVTFAGATAPASIHAFTRASSAALTRGPFGGIGLMSPSVVASMALMSRLSADLRGTTAGPLLPPSRGARR